MGVDRQRRIRDTAAICLAVLLVGLGAARAEDTWAGGDPAAGENLWKQCRACHTLDGRHRVGPSLAGLWGRGAGSAEGFPRYSEALIDSGIVWTPDALYTYLVDPNETVPGSNMAFKGMPDSADRQDLIAYIIEEIGAP